MSKWNEKNQKNILLSLNDKFDFLEAYYTLYFVNFDSEFWKWIIAYTTFVQIF